MKISEIDQAVALRNYIRNAKSTQVEALHGILDVMIAGKYLSSHVAITKELRQFIANMLQTQIDAWECELQKMGVYIDDPAS